MKHCLITGANGHLGGTLIQMLESEDLQLRGLVLPSDRDKVQDHGNVCYFSGDVTQPESLAAFFEGIDPAQTVLIHTAGLIDIGDTPIERMRLVNVQGVKNIIAQCKQRGIGRLVHVSSVHAIPEDGMRVMKEITRFSPEWVTGSYAKTKAEASQAVMDAVADGLNAVVVFPSGILGPNDQSGNHLVQLIRDYMAGKLPACVKGGYDIVDVRDVAQGCWEAALHGKSGEGYILSNRHCEIKEILDVVRQKTGGRRLPVLPMWLAKAAEPFLVSAAKLHKRRPLYTRYSLAVLGGKDRFTHDKATSELHYRPRDLTQTIEDTVAWLWKNAVALRPRRVKAAVRHVN